MNEYVTTWKEKPAGTLWTALPDCTSGMILMRALLLDSVYAYSRGTPATLKQHKWQMELQKALIAEIGHKLDSSTAEFILRAEEYYNRETQSCLVTLPAEGCRFGLWVNLAKNPRMKAIEFGGLSVTVELPKALALASCAVRVTQYDDDVVSPYASEEARAAATLMALGGVLKIDLLGLPPPSKKVKGYTMRAVTEMSTGVVRTEYPIRAADGSLPTSAPPLRVTYVLPETVLMGEGLKPEVGYWQADVQPTGEDGATVDQGTWKTDGIADVTYDPETRTLAFDTLNVNTSLTLLQPTHLELPYKRWLFSPRGGSSGDLFVHTQRFELHFSMSARGVSLKAPALPQTAHLLSSAPMPAPVLLLRLRACGINLCPKDSDALPLERVTPKRLSLEEQISSDLCALLCRYYLTNSKWCQSRGPSKAMLRLAVKPETYGEGATGYDEEAEEAAAAAVSDPFAAIDPDWPSMLVEFRRTLMVIASDDHMTCDEAPREGHIAHSTAFECLKGNDPDLVPTLTNSSVLYQDNVRQMLNSLRLFSFTKPE